MRLATRRIAGVAAALLAAVAIACLVVGLRNASRPVSKLCLNEDRPQTCASSERDPYVAWLVAAGLSVAAGAAAARVATRAR